MVTDHRALWRLHSIQPNDRIAQWIIGLQEYTFYIKHRPGTANQTANALFRLPLATPSYCFATTMTPGDKLKEVQLDYLTVRKVIEMKLSDVPKPLSLSGLNSYSTGLWALLGRLIHDERATR